MRLFFVIAVLAVGLSGACTPGPTTRTNIGCQFASDCDPSEQCLRGRCVETPQGPTRCMDDSACTANQRCSQLYGECVDGARACTAEQDCVASGLHCHISSNVCAQCNDDTHCGASAVCIDGFCADPLTAECSSDAQCFAPRTVCTGGRCVSGCLTEGCSVGLICDTTTGRCSATPTTCGGDRDCAPPVTVCESNGCVPGCVEAPSTCTNGDVCNSTTGRCEPVAQTCADDSACGAPAMICVSGTCEDGCATTGCGTDETCNTTTGHCEMTNPLEPLNAACTRDGDCLSDVCFDFGSSTGRRCVSSCGSSADCPAGFTCHANDGAKMCVNAMLFSGGTTFSLAPGATCSDDGECRSGLCTNQRCVERCSVDADCASASCHWDEVGFEVWDQRCNGPGGSRAVGSTCLDGFDCASGVCIQSSGLSARCLAHCDSTSDCGNGTICAAIDYSICTIGDFEDCNRWRVQSVKACAEDDHGNGGIGASCTRPTDCRSSLCNTNLSECTDTCSTDADCPGNFACKVDVFFQLPQGSSSVPFYFNVCLPRTS